MNKPTRDDINQVFFDVMTELARALKLWPQWPTDPLHALAVVGEEFGELTQATLQHVYEPEKSSLEDVKKEAIHSMTMHLRFLLSLHDYEFKKSKQHNQFASPAKW
jgi:hypothetical protein